MPGANIWGLARGPISRRGENGEPLRAIGTQSDLTAPTDAEARRADAGVEAGERGGPLRDQVSRELRAVGQLVVPGRIHPQAVVKQPPDEFVGGWGHVGRGGGCDTGPVARGGATGRFFERARRVDASFGRLNAEIADLEIKRENALTIIINERTAVTANRAAVFAPIAEDLKNLYTKVAADNNGNGAAKLVGNECKGCRLTINTTEVGRIATLPAEEVVRCEQCRCILVRG